jgi:protein-tyrosine phosphatase
VIDLHCHVLPGVDDGPAGLADALAMCRLAASDGVTALVATPHQRHPSFAELSRDRIEEAWRQLTAAMEGSAGEYPRVLLGAEVRVDSDLLADLERDPREVLPLAGGRYLLLELARLPGGPEPEELAHELLVAGWRPVLAHPELIPWLADDLDRLADLVEHGVLLQVTAAALTGAFGRYPADRAWRMAEAGLVHFVASDAHSPTWRPPGLSAVRGALTQRLGPAAAARLLIDNPERVLDDAPLSQMAAAGGAST